ncbi:MAG: hypothetical protein ACT4OD_00515 [Candidatus Nitrosotenuis sp.]
MLHKNQHRSANLEKIRKTIFEQNLTSISFDDSITKTYFFHKLALLADVPVICFDFDLLYSGYLAANILPYNENLELLSPKENWRDTIVQTLDKISKNQHLVLIDSLNGFFTTLIDQKDSGRIINSIIILLASVAQKADSAVVIGSTAKFKKDEGWFLPGIGRHVVEIQKMNLLAVRKQNDTLHLVLVDHDNSVKSTIPLDDLDLV